MQKHMTTLAALILGAALITGAARPSMAANHYIRAGATGSNNGADWTNAWTDLPNSFTRGDTYYVADGSYGDHTFSTSPSGTSIITIKKATASDHGTNTGWSSAYGDGQAVFEGDTVYNTGAILTFDSDYWVFDGVTRNESDWSDSTAYGFGVHVVYGSTKPNKVITIGSGADNITIQYCDLRHAGMLTGVNQDIIYCVSSADGGSQNILISRCVLHDSNRTPVFFYYASNWIVERCLIWRNDDNADPHIHREPFSINEGGLNANGVVRYNIVKDIFNTSAPATGIVVIKDSVQGGYYIYGNIFDNVYTTNGLVTDTGGDTITNVVVYNNTFVNIHGLGGTASGITSSSGTTGNIARNNVWYNSDYTPTITNFSHDYNAAESSLSESNDVLLTANPFGDEYISMAASVLVNKADTSVPAQYRTDRNGVMHDEIGALAYDGGATPPPPPPPPPPQIPVIGSVTISPNSGLAKIGDIITITVTESNGTAGLGASDARINSKNIPLNDIGGGTYRGTYTIQSGDVDGVNVEATNITLTSGSGTSVPASSSGSTLRIDATRPVISSVTLDPQSGTLHPGDSVAITVSASGNETGLYATQASFLGNNVPMTEQGGGLYGGVYTIQDADAASGSFALDAVFADDFESSGFDAWSYASAGIQVSSDSRYGSGAVSCDIQSTTEKYLNASLESSYAEYYVSYYVKLDPSFTMLDGNVMYVSMARSGDAYPWALRLRRQAGAYQLDVTLDAYETDIGQWQTVQPGQWYWVKVHYRSATNGFVQWWLDGTSGGSYSGDTSGKALDKFYVVSLGSLDEGTAGTLFWDHVQLTTTDHNEPVGGVIEAVGITLVDAAGNVSAPASSSASSLVIAENEPVTAPPSVASVTIAPNTGTRKVGSTVTITATATENETGLTPSAAVFNGRQVPLAGQGDGRYVGVYQVAEGDPDAVNPNATNVTLTGPGGTSTPASSSGSTLRIDAHTPSISSVMLTPASGTVTVGDTVTVTVTAAGNETGLTASNAMFNGRAVSLAGQGDGTYTGSYTVADNDAAGDDVKATGITLVDAAGNVSQPASSGGTGLDVVIEPPESAPVIQSVTLNPSNGLLKIGNAVLITVTAAGNQTGLTPSPATVNGRQVPLTGQGNGTYTGYYTVVENDPDATSIAATGITLTGTGGTSAPASSTGQGPAVDAHRPAIQSVTLSPNTGYIGTGDTVTITVTAAGGEDGLGISTAQLNGKSIPMTGGGDGAYTGVYTVAANDIQGINIMASNVVMTDAAGNASAPASSMGSTLIVDTRAPVVQSVNLVPNTGDVIPGGTVTVTAVALGNEAGLTPSTARINGRTIALSDIGGGLYRGVYVVLETDNESTNIEATGITLTDAAGNTSTPASSSGSTLAVKTAIGTPSQNAPRISSVRIDPSSGTLRIGGQVTIEVTAEDNQSGLVASSALFNETLVPLSDLGNGRYSGVYTVAEGQVDGENVEATGITLSNEDGTSATGSSTGSTLSIDAHRPKVALVSITPHTGWARTGTTIAVTVKAMNNEIGLTPSNATVNGVPMVLTDDGNGTYTGSYVVRQTDIQGMNVEASNITLTDAAGNVSAPASSSGSTLRIDTIAPVIESVRISPNSGTVTLGDEVVVTVTTADREPGLTALGALINMRSVSLTDRGDGTYQGVYRVAEGDYPGQYIEATNVILRDAAGNVSAAASSAGSTLNVEIEEPVAPLVKPVISSVIVSPASGWVHVGDIVTITVVEEHGMTGLTPSEVTFNSHQLPLMDNGNGSYTALYQVTEGDFDVTDAQARNITLAGAGGTTILASSSGSRLSIDANTPVVHTVELIPTEVGVGQSVIILVTAGENESGLTVSNAYVNGAAVTLRGQNDGTYRGLYTIQDADLRGQKLEVTGITLTDAAGNVSAPGPVAAVTIVDDRDDTIPSGDTTAPQISSVTITPRTGWVKAGDDVTITAAARDSETGLIASSAFINNEFVPLTGKDDGTYQGIYTVREGDSQGRNIEAMGITLTDAAGNVSQSASSFGSSLNVDTDVPVINSVELSSPAGKILGVLGTGQSVSIVVTARERETGLIPSNAQINGKSIPLSDQGDGTYRGTYTISADDNAGDNIEAGGITLTDQAGNVSASGASTGSGLSVQVTPAVEPEETDFDNDGSVSFTDFTLFILAYGRHEGSPGWDRKYDLNHDSEVDLGDFFIFVGNYGKRSNRAAKSAIAASVPSQSHISMDLALDMDEAAGMTYARVSLSDPAALNGFEFSLSYDSRLYEYDESTTAGLVGLSIPMFTDGGIRIASVFPDEEFGGVVTLGFRHIGPATASGIELIDGMLIETDGITRVPELSGGGEDAAPAAFIYDLAVERVSEEFVLLSWTAPAAEGMSGYVVETSHTAPTADGWEPAGSITITGGPDEPGMTGTVRVNGLAPGMPYYLAVRPMGGETAIGRSNIVETQTLSRFIDDDLDPDDPYIIRDQDSLFVADNDRLVTFDWSSWADFGAAEYIVTVTTGGAAAGNGTPETIQDTRYSYESSAGATVSITIQPVTEGGAILGNIMSRTILCAPGQLDTPGKPSMVLPEE